MVASTIFSRKPRADDLRVVRGAASRLLAAIRQTEHRYEELFLAADDEKKTAVDRWFRHGRLVTRRAERLFKVFPHTLRELTLAGQPISVAEVTQPCAHAALVEVAAKYFFPPSEIREICAGSRAACMADSDEFRGWVDRCVGAASQLEGLAAAVTSEWVKAAAFRRSAEMRVGGDQGASARGIGRPSSHARTGAGDDAIDDLTKRLKKLTKHPEQWRSHFPWRSMREYSLDRAFDDSLFQQNRPLREAWDECEKLARFARANAVALAFDRSGSDDVDNLPHDSERDSRS